MAGVALAGILALGVMAGCSSGPKSCEELLARYEGLENRENYTFVSDLDISVGGDGFFDYETTGEVTPAASHMTTHGMFFGHDTNNQRYVELEGDAYVQYRSIDIAGASLWARSEVDGIAPTSALTTHDLLATGTFAATEDGYTISVPGSEFMGAVIGQAVDSFPDLTTETKDDRLSSPITAYQASEAVYAFNKDCELTGISYAMEGTGGDDGSAVSGADYSVAVTYTFDGYGTVDPASVAVTPNAKEKAIDVDDAIATTKELAGEVIDKVGYVAQEGLEKLGSTLGGVDASALIEQVGTPVPDAA
jgi:hypothetical protein